MVTLAEELPFAAAVDNEHLGVICSSCFSSEGNKSRCIGCKVVSYCNTDCQKKDWIDHKYECSFMKKSSKILPTPCRLMARIIMKFKRPDAKEPAFNGRVFDDLMDHRVEMNKDPERMTIFMLQSQSLREYMGDKLPNPTLLFLIFGIVTINSLGIINEGYYSGQGLYLGLSVHDHSCVPDMHILCDGLKVSLRSPDPNKKYSEDLTVSYTNTLLSNQERKGKLQTFYYFTCSCALCSDTTFDFLYNSARSTCCPDSYCLLNTDAKELSCNKCGAVSGISVQEAVISNKDASVYGENYRLCVTGPDSEFDLQDMIEAYEKFSKILSPLNINLFLLNERLFRRAFKMDTNHPVSQKYAENLLPVSRRYYTAGDPNLSTLLVVVALSLVMKSPPTKEVLELIKEACAAVLVSHGPEHRQTMSIGDTVSLYEYRLKHYTRHGIDLLDS